ncbi:hypothetical protein [Sporomusa acidovorans]|uniref:Uncharacterized protein n=1 Tax=Sporomusa acidovorans (strain ATCC 49682 / DSM 3132 / Mol) TaxID=1123286 RepID=A0ABZ3IWB1_SPOA4|nr:hypothetical protein [Sporomusa acidovorans]OZC23880.1 hypothetical protein SPACI_03970 [Sporomusa acidovorans DSM 3132]SDF54701.1 hypothetical protein SAMN04488499_105721 [Sporomusa acidovorans]
MVDKQDFEMTKEELEELMKKLPEILKEIEMPVVSDEKCVENVKEQRI